MQTTTTTFEQVKISRRKVVKCACGKRLVRSKTFWHTVNPWNKNTDTGKPKTFSEVRADVLAEADKWQAAPELCGECAEKEQAQHDA